MRARALIVPIVALMLSACGGNDPDPGLESPSETSEEATEEATEEAATQASESFEDMLDRVGIEPDDVSSFEEYATESLCESEMTDIGPGFRYQVQNWSEDDPEAGRSPELVDYVIENSCPERSQDAAKYQGEMG